MKTIAFSLLVLLLVGCTSTKPRGAPNFRAAQVTNESEEIAVHEQRCIRAANQRSDELIARTAAAQAVVSIESGVKDAIDARDQEVLQCRREAERENQELSLREVREYSLRANQEHDQASLMMILTTSMPR